LLGAFCRERRIPVSVADAPDACTFYFPAIVTKGPAIIGVSSGGESHELVRKTAALLRLT
jgi:siroheme synthase (precorrin-2 oxidase/ferrochelatase)